MPGADRHADHLRDTSIDFLERFRFGSLALAAAGTGLYLTTIGAMFVGPHLIVVGGFVVFWSLWVVGIHLVSTPRATMGRDLATDQSTTGDWTPFRFTCIIIPGIAIALSIYEFFCSVAAIRSPAGVSYRPADVFDALGEPLILIGIGIGLASHVAGLIAAAAVADWANDLDLGHKLRTTPFWILISLLLGAYAIWRMSIPIGPVYFTIASLAAIGGFLIFLMCMWRLWGFANLGRWAARNRAEADERLARISEKVKRRVENTGWKKT
jgi:hypothetical protein